MVYQFVTNYKNNQNEHTNSKNADFVQEWPKKMIVFRIVDIVIFRWEIDRLDIGSIRMGIRGRQS